MYMSSVEKNNKVGLGIPILYKHFYVQSDLGPPAGQDKVSVDVLLSKLLGDVEPQGAVLVINITFGGIVEDGVGIVDLLKLFRCLRIVWVLVRVVFQGQFPLRKRLTIARCTIVALQTTVFGSQQECRPGLEH